MNDPVLEIPALSIVTPSYNQGHFLAETIESVIGQEGNFLLDYVIVDGASTDNSVDIIRRYEQLLHNGKWPVKCRGIQYRWISEKDKGQTDALAKGFRMSKGAILAWLNSDDTYLPGALQAVTDFFLRNPATGLLYGDSYYLDPHGTIIGKHRTASFDRDKLAYFNFVCQPSAFFRRDVFEAAGGLDETLHFAMDYDLWIRIGQRFTCHYQPHFYSVYRLHEASKTICDDTLWQNSEEGLRVAMKYYDWAPLTRVYNSCTFSCRTRLPPLLARYRLVVIVTAIACTLTRSIQLNRGIRKNDLKLLNRKNFRKLFKDRIALMTEPEDETDR